MYQLNQIYEICKYEPIIIWYGTKTTQVCDIAVHYGNLPLLKYAIQRGCTFDIGYAICNLLHYKQLDCFMYLVELSLNSYKLDVNINNVCILAARDGHLAALKCLLSTYWYTTELYTVMYYAYVGGHTNCFMVCVNHLVSHKRIPKRALRIQEICLAHDLSVNTGNMDYFLFCMNYHDCNEFIYDKLEWARFQQKYNLLRQQISTNRTRQFEEELISKALHPSRMAQWIDE